MFYSFYTTLTDREIPVRLDVTYYKPLRQGKYDGPWEHCYPDEYAEVEFDIKTPKGYNASFLVKHLLPEELLCLEEWCIEKIEEQRQAEKDEAMLDKWRSVVYDY